MSTQFLKSFQFAQNVSMTTSYTSSPIQVEFGDNVGIELGWTGNPTGTFSVEISISYDPATHAAGNWISLALAPAITASGAADTAYIDINQTSAAWIRIVYTATSDTGTLNGFISYKPV